MLSEAPFVHVHELLILNMLNGLPVPLHPRPDQPKRLVSSRGHSSPADAAHIEVGKAHPVAGVFSKRRSISADQRSSTVEVSHST